jgi:hypothetical protein
MPIAASAAAGGTLAVLMTGDAVSNRGRESRRLAE